MRFRGWVSTTLSSRAPDDAPEFVRGEFFAPGKVYEGVKCVSPTPPVFLPSLIARDRRGMAIAVGDQHFLLTSAPTDARNSKEFMAIEMAQSGFEAFADSALACHHRSSGVLAHAQATDSHSAEGIESRDGVVLEPRSLRLW